MPRVRPLTEAAQDREAFNLILDVKRAQARIPNWTALADGLGVDRGTLYTWRHDPGCIPRRKLRELFRYLKYTPEDIFNSFGYGRPS